MFTKASTRSIARSIIALLCLGLIEVGVSAPIAQAAAPIKPTISSITSGATSLTVNMSSAGMGDATSWRWSITRNGGVGCANSYGDGSVQSTGSLTSTIEIVGLTSGCTYKVKVAAYNGVIGEYVDGEKLVGAFTNGLRAYYKNEVGFSANATYVPFTSGTCGSGVVSNIDIDYGSNGPSGCNSDGFTTYYIGYLKAPYTGSVTFRNSSDDGFYLNIQGQNVIAYATESGPQTYNSSGSITMVAGEIYRIEAWHHEYTVGAAARLYWDWSGQSTVIVPSSNLATDPSVFFGTCPLGSAERCSAGSALEIKQATGTNMDGLYWIDVNGVPTLTYCIMNSAMSGGGWMLAMKGKKAGSTLDYGDALWTNSSTLNAEYPQRWKSGDTPSNTFRDIDAKYGVFAYNKANQILALFPEQNGYAGGAIAAGTTGNTTEKYGFSWLETTTAMRPWTSYNASAVNGNPAGWGGTSWNVAITGGPTAVPTCVNTATTLSNLFSTASRCAFRQVSNTYSASESPYSAVGDNLFYTQNRIRFFGINYGSANTANRDRARIGFGWNENDVGNESSNDGTGGIGIDRQGYSSITTGSINNCCETGQAGISGANDGSSTNIPFELYIRNSITTPISGSDFRVTAKKSSTSAGTFSATSISGSPVYRLNPRIEGISINSSTGQVSVSESLPIGTYSQSVTVTDSEGVTGVKAVAIQVIADSGETDTALSMSQTNFAATQYAKAEHTSSLVVSNAITIQAWVRPTSFNASNWTMVVNKELSYQLGITSSDGVVGYWNYALKGSGWSGINTGIKVALNEWHHVAFTRATNTNEVKFYLDGQLAYTGNADGVGTGAISDSGLPLTIGARYNDGSGYVAQFKGSIDHVAIYSEARTQGQIQSDMQNYINIDSSSLVAFYDFNEGSGSAIYNRKAGTTNATDLTIVGSVTWTDIKVVDTQTLPAYTIVKFPRTYLTANGGWKVPANIPKVSAITVAGGGGGGSRAGGGGGAGGLVYQPILTLTPNSVEQIIVGQGGSGGFSLPAFTTKQGRNGQNSIFGSHANALGGGGGGGAAEIGNTYRTGLDGGSGGGASGDYSVYNTSAAYGYGTQFSTYGMGLGNNGGSGRTGDYWPGGGGGGAGGAGGTSASTTSKAGNGGLGFLDPVGGTGKCLAGGGGGGINSAAGSGNAGDAGGCTGGASTASAGTVGSVVPSSAEANSGSGGGGSGWSNSSDVAGGSGGSGVIIIRWITATKPTFTPPTNAYLNERMTETFTVNVASDSATVNLTRTFRWESTTGGSGGTYSVIKEGTGAANAFFAWTPTDTSTSGSNYLYRVIVTDSDTAGLFIVETSTPVFAVINRALVVSGTAGIAKTINVAKSETFTISLGTSTYRTTLTSNNPGITLDTSTATAPVVRIAETMTVGTYYETLTVTDSVSATIITPLTIVVATPPSFTSNLETVDQGTILYLDPGNSSSYSGTGTRWNDLSGRNVTTSIQPNNLPATNGGPSSCTSPTYLRKNKGIFTFNKADKNCAFATDLGLMNKAYTYQVWLKRDGVQSDWTSVIATPFLNNTTPIAISLHFKTVSSTLRVEAGIWDGNGWDLATAPSEVPDQTWIMATVTFNGTNSMSLSINAGTKVTSSVSVTWAPTTMDKGLFIGKRFDTDIDYFNGSIGMIRIYDRVLTDAEILQNYNATASRFDSAKEFDTVLTQKYGTSTTESFTATSGYGSRTISFVTGDKPGLSYTTSGDVTTLRIGESLTATTHYETITVTDSLGASTYLPISMIVTKADTLTVAMDTATTVVYNSAPITVYPKVYFKGLAGADTLTVSTRFTSPTYTDSATVPTDVDTYTVIAANPIFSVGALSNYVNVVYETSTAIVTQANQNKLTINLYGAVAGTPFLIQTFGGSGDGAVTESVTAGSTATGCAVSNHVLSNTSPSTQQLTCNILVTKAASKNYKVETLTATVYFMLYVNHMPTNQVGSGSTIALNGINSVWVDPGATPTITGPGAGTYASNSPITITGSGFSLGPITVKFERNQLGTNITVASDTSMTVTIPAGARSGVFSVTNKNGTEFSSFAITIG